jgi:trigger factor
LKVTQGETKDRQTVLEIEVDDELLEQHVGRAYQRLSNRINVPGFRKGKAPRSVVERFVGREHLVEEALDTLVPAAVSGAVEQEGLEASATPTVSVKEREPVIKLEAIVPLSAEGTLGEYADIRFDDEAAEVTDEQVEESVERLVEARASWDDVERPVEAGDLITFTSNGSVDGETFMDQKDAEYLADADNPNPVPGFSGSLVGIENGGSKSFSIEIPPDFSREELAGKTARSSVMSW